MRKTVRSARHPECMSCATRADISGAAERQPVPAGPSTEPRQFPPAMGVATVAAAVPRPHRPPSADALGKLSASGRTTTSSGSQTADRAHWGRQPPVRPPPRRNSRRRHREPSRCRPARGTHTCCRQCCRCCHPARSANGTREAGRTTQSVKVDAVLCVEGRVFARRPRGT